MLKRISILASVFLAACVPGQRAGVPAPTSTQNCADPSPSLLERTAWRVAKRQNTEAAYRNFLTRYPRSCYAPLATAQIKKPVTVRKPTVVRNVTPAPARKASVAATQKVDTFGKAY